MAKKTGATNGTTGNGLHKHSQMPAAGMNTQGNKEMAQNAASGMGGGMRAMNDMGGGMMGGSGMSGNSGNMPFHEGGTSTLEKVLVEIRVTDGDNFSAATKEMTAGLSSLGFQSDPDFKPVPMEGTSSTPSNIVRGTAAEKTILLKGVIESARKKELEKQPNVVRVWKDTLIAPFTMLDTEVAPPPKTTVKTKQKEPSFVFTTEGLAACPIGVCDCAPGTPRGTIADVASYLGVNDIWNAGFRGEGIVVGVVDGGITAQGRAINSGDTSNPEWPNKLVQNVIGGWPTDSWGTTGVAWGWHGNMCSTDVLGIAPNCQLYDIRISSNDSISAALSGFQSGS